jgi:hypothetical protein
MREPMPDPSVVSCFSGPPAVGHEPDIASRARPLRVDPSGDSASASRPRPRARTSPPAGAAAAVGAGSRRGRRRCETTHRRRSTASRLARSNRQPNLPSQRVSRTTWNPRPTRALTAPGLHRGRASCGATCRPLVVARHRPRMPRLRRSAAGASNAAATSVSRAQVGYRVSRWRHGVHPGRGSSSRLSCRASV